MSVSRRECRLIVLIVSFLVLVYYAVTNSINPFHQISLISTQSQNLGQLGSEKAEDLEWLTIRATEEEQNYGDGTCPPNPNLPILKSMFRYWKDLADQYSIPYFLVAGSLVGAWRDGGLIPYDHDIDIIVSYDDFSKLSNLRDERPFVIGADNKIRLVLQHDWRLDGYERRLHNCQNREVEFAFEDGCAFRFVFARIFAGNHSMDVYVYSVEQNNTIVHDLSMERKIPFKDVFPLRRCKFLGFDTKCPCNPHGYFKIWYMDDMRPFKVCKQGKWVRRSMKYK